MMASALIRRSFFFEELGEPAKDPVLSTNSLRNKAIPICNQKIEIDLIFPSTPVPPYETTSIYGESHLLHRMVLRFELVILFLVKILSSESKRPRRPLILTCKVSRYKLRTFWKFFSLFKVQHIDVIIIESQGKRGIQQRKKELHDERSHSLKKTANLTY